MRKNTFCKTISLSEKLYTLWGEVIAFCMMQIISVISLFNTTLSSHLETFPNILTFGATGAKVVDLGHRSVLEQDRY